MSSTARLRRAASTHFSPTACARWRREALVLGAGGNSLCAKPLQASPCGGAGWEAGGQAPQTHQEDGSRPLHIRKVALTGAEQRQQNEGRRKRSDSQRT